MFFVTVRNGIKIAVEDLNCGAEKTIVMVHGWPLSGKIFEYQKDFLTRFGYRVVTLDLRGFGQSDAPTYGYSYDEMASDIRQVVQALHLNCFVLAGFSMGGAIAIRYISRYNGYGVKKLVLMGAAAPSFTKRPGVPYGQTREYVNQLISQAETDRPALAESFGKMLLATPHSNAVLQWFTGISFGASGIGTIETARSLRDEDLCQDMKKIHVPTGIFHGKKDMVVPFELGQMQQQEICNSVLYPFENSGHAVFYDELEQFHKALLCFLEH